MQPKACRVCPAGAGNTRTGRTLTQPTLCVKLPKPTDECRLDILFNTYFCSSQAPGQAVGRADWTLRSAQVRCCERLRREACVFRQVRPACLVQLQLLRLAQRHHRLDRERVDCGAYDHRRCANRPPIWLLVTGALLVLTLACALVTLNTYWKYKTFIYVDI